MDYAETGLDEDLIGDLLALEASYYEGMLTPRRRDVERGRSFRAHAAARQAERARVARLTAGPHARTDWSAYGPDDARSTGTDDGVADPAGP